MSRQKRRRYSSKHSPKVVVNYNIVVHYHGEKSNRSLVGKLVWISDLAAAIITILSLFLG